MSAQKFVVWFDEVDKSDVALVGGKGANLGEMTKAGFPVPPGFIVTSEAYFHFLEQNKLEEKIKRNLANINYNDPRDLNRISYAIRKDINNAPVPLEISKLVIKYYFLLSEYINSKRKKHHSVWRKFKAKAESHETSVAIRSSATAEDLPEASFAGQQDTYLNIRGEANVLEKVRDAWSSLFTPRAIYYRFQNNFDHLKVGIAIPIQKMISSESSGVMFTIDPVTNRKNVIVIEAIYGLGEMIVQGAVIPDHYEVDKDSLKIKSCEVSEQKYYLPGFGKRKAELPRKIRSKQKINAKTILSLANLGKRLEKHYYFPQDIEWGIYDEEIFILQTRPITTINQVRRDTAQKINLDQKVILSGSPASPGIGAGRIVKIKTADQISKVKTGDVLVALQTNPDFVPAMKNAAAIVTERGGRTSNAAIVSRELGIPAVVGVENAIKTLLDDMEITVDGTSGKIYQGLPPPAVLEKIRTANLTRFDSNLKTAVKVYVNLADSSRVQEISSMNVDGIGLLRAEFMLARIGIHPKKIIKEGKKTEFINRLSEEIAIFCKSFGAKKPVVYRTTDFKTNEYKNLKFGYLYEKDEENPMLGFRGAYRYIENSDVFEMELSAIKKVRNNLGFKNLFVMIPYVHTPNELSEVKKIMSIHGLQRGGSFKIWMMVEIPANVISIEDFLKIGIDGVSIGSNDLTQLTLGVDRDNSLVAKIFSEKNPAVLWSLEKVIRACHKYSVTSSICGQAPSDYPDLVEKLVRWGITSVSVNVDAIGKVRETIYKVENSLSKN